MSQVRCSAADGCPNQHVCLHAKQHTKDSRSHSGSRAVGCCHPNARCHPVPKGEKCIVHGCQNHKGEGGFVGDMCGPCHCMLTTGTVGHGQTFIHKMRDAMVHAAHHLTEQIKETTGPQIGATICSEHDHCPDAKTCLHAKWHLAGGRGHGFGPDESRAVGCKNPQARCE